MHQFITVLLKIGVVFSLLLAGGLILIAVLLIKRPEVIIMLLRYGGAALCIGAALWIIAAPICALIGSRVQDKKSIV